MEKQNGRVTDSRKLSLQQKMVEIRKMIPALTKKTYSEEVSYDFVKIDDIFLYLTPALNKYGVNLDILSEKATKADEHGNPVYVQYLPQSQLWMYEVDLTLRWINADDPQDMEERTIHAIGTHEMPDKAKGSAWTYALKYYLLNRFCIDQGANGEDPDMYSYSVIDNGDDGENRTAECGEEVYANEEDDEQMEPQDERQTADLDEFQDVADEETPFSNAEPEAPANNKATLSKRTEIKDIPTASSQVRPESGRMVQLPETAVLTKPQAVMTIEEASQVVCRCGTYRNWTLGRIAQENDGIETLEWLANGYRGKDDMMRQGAKILLQAAMAA